MVKLERECIVSIINANTLSNANASSALSMPKHCQMRMHRQHYQTGMQLQFQLTVSEILAANSAVISLASLVCYSLRV